MIKRKSLLLYLFLTINCAVFISFPAYAEDNNRSALIIGISKYMGPASDLLGVPADVESAKTIAEAMGIPQKNIIILRDQKATKTNITEALQSFSKKAADGGRVFIYFSGHGTRSFSPEVNGCIEGLLTYDYETITHSEMAQSTKSLNNSVDKSIFMVDACHAGGVVNALKTRSLENSKFKPKFASKTVSGEETCAPSNYKTRGLFNETRRLGAISENVVFITAARPDEVSWDEGVGRGGVATQAVRDCLLGGAVDLNSSGAVSLEEVRKCAQSTMNQKMPGPVQIASNLTITGNRNLLPVINKPLVTTSTLIKPTLQLNSEPNKQPSAPTSAEEAKPPPTVIAQEQQISKPPSLASVQEFKTAYLETLKDVEAQQNPQRKLDVRLANKTLKINKDYLDLSIKSNHDGYLYLALLGSDKKSFYILYPNKLDSNNFIKAGQTIKLPSQSWQIKAAGPAGIDHILVIVADSPRDLKALDALGSDPNSPFVFSLNNLQGRTALIDYLTGKSPDGKSDKFSAKILTVSEVL